MRISDRSSDVCPSDLAVGGGDDYEEIRYEGFGPAGVSLIVEALTDNRNRTATNVRTIFSKNGGNLGASGSVSHAFDRLGLITYPAKRSEEHTSELQSLMRISYAVFCLKKKTQQILYRQ